MICLSTFPTTPKRRPSLMIYLDRFQGIIEELRAGS